METSDGAPAGTLDDALDDALGSYTPTDRFFGRPFVDVDEPRDEPVPHRYVHGGFEGTATRFSCYFPPHGGARFFHFLEGGYGGNEHQPVGGAGFPGLPYAASRGGFFVQGNQGHIGAEACPKAGDDVTVYAYRATAECARLARHLAAAVYGDAPRYGYLFGGSGGGMRSLAALEHVEDDDMPWEAAVSSLHSRDVMRCYSAMNNARRVLGDRFASVVDAVEPGGSGNPFDGLTTAERDVLAHLYACGFPRGAERSAAEGANAGMALWAWYADNLVAGLGDWFRGFWAEPGHAGADRLLDADVVDTTTIVTNAVTSTEAATYELGGLSRMFLSASDKRVGITVEAEVLSSVLGSRITVLTGKAAGRVLYCTAESRGLLLGSSIGEAQTLLFDGVEPGDEVHLDNRDYLAFCHYSLHHVESPELARRLFMDGNPIYPLDQVAPEIMGSASSPIFGPVPLKGGVRRPLIFVMHACDTSAWPPGGALNDEAMREHLGEQAEARYRCYYLDQTEHVPASSMASSSLPAPTTRLNDYAGAHEFALDAAAAWVEHGVAPPPSTNYTLDLEDMCVRFPSTAAARRGIQPVVSLTTNGAGLAEVGVGEDVGFVVRAEVPEGAGVVVELLWDFDGRGAWPERRSLDAPQSSVRAEVLHAYDAPGTYFPAVRVRTHAAGDHGDPFGRPENLGRCRVVVS